jgi:hypothetical protein
VNSTKSGAGRTLPYGQTPGAPGRKTSGWRRQARSVRTCFHRNGKPIRDFRKSSDQACTTAGWPINPGLYAGRIGDRVKIGQSMNVAQRVDSFKFEELIGLKPFVPSDRRADEHPEDHALAVKRELMTREREIHTQASD